MKKIECTFYRPAQVNIGEFQNIIMKLEHDFYVICAEEADEKNICEYALTLLKQAKPLKKNSEMYFIGLDDPEKMPSDARVDFFYRPTYLAAAIVMKVYMMIPGLLNEKADILAFRGILLGSTGRVFKGHGFDDLKGLIDTLDIFTRADASEFIRRYPDYCLDFTNLFRESIVMIKDRLLNESVCNEWGEDYSEDAQQVICRIHPM